ESRIKALNCGVEGFLTKPIDESELTAQINAMLKIRFSTIHKQNEKERLEILVAERTKNLKDELIRRKQTEESLYESEEINRSITQTAADAIISINSEGLVIAWNNAAEKIFGYTSSEMMGKILTKIIPTQNRKKHNQGVFRFKNGGKEKLIGKTIVIDALRKDGTEFPIELSLSSWISANNKKYFTSIIRDITARKEKETTLLQFRYAMSSSSDMMAMLNEKFKYQLANDAYCKKFK
ncbi:MAG: PAS domain S-box protein, partial [Lutibacter sp.]|nr:PAS domain S-box protein [Lutibacter sp.]